MDSICEILIFFAETLVAKLGVQMARTTLSATSTLITLSRASSMLGKFLGLCSLRL